MRNLILSLALSYLVSHILLAFDSHGARYRDPHWAPPDRRARYPVSLEFTAEMPNASRDDCALVPGNDEDSHLLKLSAASMTASPAYFPENRARNRPNSP